MADIEKVNPEDADDYNDMFIVTAKGRLKLTNDGIASIMTEDGKTMSDFVVSGDVVTFMDTDGNSVSPPFEGEGFLCVGKRGYIN